MEWTSRRARDYVAQTGLLGEGVDVTADEIGDGNLNVVFRVRRADGQRSVILKQAPAYIKVLGPEYPLTQQRLAVEARAMALFHELAPGSVPEPLRYDADEHVLLMEDLSGYRILRRSLMAGEIEPAVAAVVGRSAAAIHLGTLAEHAPPAAVDRARRQLDNPDMRGITAEYVFTRPFRDDPTNRHTEGLDDVVAEIRRDDALVGQIDDLRQRFVGEGEAAVHGDLHTGSVMARGPRARMIDLEFAFFGPIAFDVGALVANYLLAWHAQPAARGPALLGCVEACWRAYRETFVAGVGAVDRAETLWHEAVRFAGVKMMRRILGAAHVEDIESIADVAERRAVERRALACGRRLVVQPPAIDDLAAVLAAG